MLLAWGLVGLTLALAVTGCKGPAEPSNVPSYSSPLPVYVSGVAVAVVGWSHWTTWLPAVVPAPGTKRQYCPVATDRTKVELPGSTALLLLLIGCITNCSAALWPLPEVLVTTGLVALSTYR
jgi:hypothetical protein